jgi:hypothetical protein
MIAIGAIGAEPGDVARTVIYVVSDTRLCWARRGIG